MVNHKVKSGNVKLTLSINKEILNKYKEHCGKKGLIISKQVENFIESQLEKK